MKNKKTIFNLRKEYSKRQLSFEDLPAVPSLLFHTWFHELVMLQKSEANAFVLSTVSECMQPTSRVVLLKSYGEDAYVFFSNYNSNKAKDILKNPKVSMLFFWETLERQIRIEGTCQKVSEQESDVYFKSRPRESQIGAFISKQSEILENPKNLMQDFDFAMQRLCYEEIPRPTNWGGYKITAHRYEFWQGRPARLHNRFVYEKNIHGLWNISCLYP
jgi:pyridoxamine 5'-phosphate oxidase